MLLRVLVLLLLKISFLHANFCTENYGSLILDFFHENLLSSGVIFMCCSSSSFIIKNNFLTHQLMLNIINLNKYELNDDDSLNELKLDFNSLGVVIDLECTNAVEVIQKASHYNMFNVSYYWLALATEKQRMVIFENEFLRLDTNLWFAEQDSFDNFTWNIIDLYNMGLRANYDKMRKPQIGVWNFTSGLQIYEKESKFERRKNFGTELRASCVLVVLKLKITFMDFLKSDTNIDQGALFRYHYQLVRDLGLMYNYTLSIIRVRTWGYSKNGTYDGMVGLFLSGQIDIGGSGLFIRKDRLEIMELVGPSWRMHPQFFFRHPKVSTGGKNVFLRPLENEVWYSTCLCCIIMMALLKIILWFEKVSFRVEGYDQPDDASFGYIILVIFGALTQQGTSQIPVLISGRIIVCILMFFAWTVFQFYSGSIMSSLLMRPPKTIRTIKDLTDSNLEVGFEDTPYMTDWFQNAKDPIEMALYNKKLAPRGNRPLQKFAVNVGMEKVYKGGFAFHVDDNSFYKQAGDTWDEESICELAKISFRPEQRLLTPLPKNSSLVQHVAIGITKLSERGIIHHENRKWHPPLLECTASLNTNSFHVGIDEVLFCFTSLAAGTLASFIIFLWELFKYRRENSKTNDIRLRKQKNI